MGFSSAAWNMLPSPGGFDRLALFLFLGGHDNLLRPFVATQRFRRQEGLRLGSGTKKSRAVTKNLDEKCNKRLEESAEMEGDPMTLCKCPDAAQLLVEAREGNDEALGVLLALYRDYLHGRAGAMIGLHLQGVVNPSDMVQQTFLEAYQDFSRFEGSTEAQWRAWLRRILAHNLANLVQKHVRARKRDRRREISLERRFAAPGSSEGGHERAMASVQRSPSAQAQRREESAVLASKLALLPEDYREVLVLRNYEGRSFEEVAHHMGRTSGAVRILWVRALDRLRLLLKEEELIGS
jgi:RNA polymerase sigma-70 factor (ECF subfamily)